MLPFVFHIGSFYLPTYGVLVSLAFLIGLWVAARLARRSGLDAEAALNLGIYVAIAGIVGAKLLMVLFDLSYYLGNPRELFSLATFQSAGIFYGGFLLALAVAFFYMRRTKLPALATADVFAPAVALGHAIGRLGCFSAGCCWGAPSRLPWAVTFTNSEAHRIVGVPLGMPLHPTQLYEAAAEAIICLALLARIKRPHAPGSIIGWYLVLYSTARFLVEFVRAHDPSNPYYGPFVVEQWIALGLIGLGAWLILRRAPAPAVKPKRA